MGSLDDEGPRKLLCLTACLYRKPGMSPEDYHKYVSDVHVPLVNDLMVEFGVVHRTLVRNSSSTFNCPTPNITFRCITMEYQESWRP